MKFEEEFPSLAREIIGSNMKDTNTEWRLQVSNNCIDKQKVKEVLDRILFGDKWADKEFAYMELGLKDE